MELYYNTLELLDPDHFDKTACDFFVILFRKRMNPCPHTLPDQDSKPSPPILSKELGHHEEWAWLPQKLQ